MRQKIRKVFLVLCMAESRHVFKILVGKQQSRRKLNNRMHGRNSNIKVAICCATFSCYPIFLLLHHYRF